ncbi:MAG: carboxymuconolactone decarboxylase family protein [Acidimicrobiales bacterium]
MNGQEVLDELRAPAVELRGAIPGVWSAYAQLSKVAMAEGAVSAKTKELIALAVAVTRECDGCIASHARGAARQGATAEEVAETLGVAVLLNGGPGTVFGPRAFAAFQEFSARYKSRT